MVRSPRDSEGSQDGRHKKVAPGNAVDEAGRLAWGAGVARQPVETWGVSGGSSRNPMNL